MNIEPCPGNDSNGLHAFWELHRFPWPWHARIFGFVRKCLFCGRDATKDEYDANRAEWWENVS